ncbi:hypothetical protein [Mycolicibacterium sp.]|uniref:hypothetical protein n=1 Tax=Mycolicibacterium sp. TaxID=2320850 RepID=UPI003D0A1948
MTDLSHRRGTDDAEVRTAVRTGLGFAVAAGIFLVTAAMWMSTCTGSVADAMACGAPQRAALALGAPAILVVGGIWSLTCAHRVRRDRPAWSVWLGAGATLVVLAVISAVVSAPTLP